MEYNPSTPQRAKERENMSTASTNSSARKRRELNGSIQIDSSPSPKKEYEISKFSRDVKLLAQVERIWVMYDVNNDGDLQFDEIKEYLDLIMRNTAHSEDDLRKIFDEIDEDGNGEVDKEEMFRFLSKVIKDPDELRFTFKENLKPEKMQYFSS